MRKLDSIEPAWQLPDSAETMDGAVNPVFLHLGALMSRPTMGKESKNNERTLKGFYAEILGS